MQVRKQREQAEEEGFAAIEKALL